MELLRLTQIFFVELLGCMFFHFVGSANPTPWGNAVILCSMVYYCSKISSSHLNPCVSLTFTLLGHINPLEMIIYWSAQIAGCILGALLIWGLIPTDYLHLYNGCFVPNDALTHSTLFGWEALGTTIFLLPVFSMIWFTKHESYYGSIGPIQVGLALLGSAFAAGQWTGAAFNPARVLGSPAVFNCHNNQYLFYYIIGELTGAVFTALLTIPWYGIYENSWYLHLLPYSIDRKLTKFQPGLRKIQE
jgi:glycerol uptake facilitator-like aquaporin